MKKLEHVLSGCYSTSWRGKPAELSLSPSLFIRATPERERRRSMRSLTSIEYSVAWPVQTSNFVLVSVCELLSIDIAKDSF